MLNNNIFQKQKNKILSGYNINKGIGTLGEKTLHKIIKYSLEEDENYHEIKIGKYYADIFTNNSIYEIQTRSFNKLRDKLSFFLEKYETYVVYPIFLKKWIYWVDEEKNEIKEKRKSPKIGSLYDSVLELYKIKHFLKNENLKFIFIFLNVSEYKSLNGWDKSKKKGASRIDIIPLDLVNIIEINNTNDFKIFLPTDIPSEFTNSDFKKIAKTNLRIASVCTNILSFLGIIKETRKIGNKKIYKIN